MKLQTAYGRFAAAVNSRIGVLVAFLLCVAVLPALAQTPSSPAPVAQPGAPAGPIKLAILGDSLAAGYGLTPAHAFPAKLDAALRARGRNVAVINHGVSGDTTAGGLERIDWMMADKPDIVLIELGGNDGLRALDPAATERNLDAIVSKLKAAGVTVWLAGMLAPRNFGADYAKAFDGLFKAVADKYELPFYPFFLDGVAQDPALNQADGIHPNAKGVDIIVERILPFVTENLDKYATTVRRPARP